MIFMSPFWLQNKEYTVLLGRTSPDNRMSQTGEYCYYIVYVNDRVFWQSSEFPASKLDSSTFQLILPPWTVSWSVVLHYLRYANASSYVTQSPVTGRRLRRRSRGATKAIPITIGGRHVMYRKAMNSVRLSTSRQIKSSRSVRSPYVRSSTVRASPEQSFRPFNKRQEIWNGSSWSVNPNTIVPMLVYQRTWSGVRTPGFGSTRKKNLPVNPHSVLIANVLVNRSLTSSFFTNGSSGNNWTRLYTERLPEPSPLGHNATARNNCLRKLIDQAELGIQANIAQDLAQFGQTFGLIASNATKIVNSVRQLKRGNIPGAVSTLVHGYKASRFTIPRGKPSLTKSTAENWLEIQYGWKPLLQDIEGALQALSNSKVGGFVSKAVASGNGNSESLSSQTPDLAGMTKSITVRKWTETHCRMVLRYKLADRFKSFLAQTGFTNPINLVWEILPFSFVVDWFLPIGPYLEAFSAFDGLEFLDGSQTLFSRARVSASMYNTEISTLNPTVTQSEFDEYRAEYVMLDRTKMLSFPTPTFPAFKNGFASLTHASNAIALLKANF